MGLSLSLASLSLLFVLLAPRKLSLFLLCFAYVESRSGRVAARVTAGRFAWQVTKLWTSRGDRYSASKLLGERVAWQVTGRVAGRVGPYIEASSDKALDESLGDHCRESCSPSKLLGEEVARQVTG
jgi:hypothetical protein